MQAARILPDLQCSLLCDEVRQEANGNLFLIGVITYVRLPQVPLTAFRLCIYNRWTAGVGQFTESIRFIAPDQTTVIRKAEQKFELRDAAMHFNSVSVLMQVEFKVPGVYYIEVLVDDVMKLRYPVHVSVAQPQQPNTSTQPPAAGA